MTDQLRPGKKAILAAAAITLLAVAAAFLVWSRSGWYLTLRDTTGELYARYPIQNGEWFSVEFIHSVNKSPLTDCYQIQDHQIYVEKTIYYGFGAGVQTEIEPGQELTYGDDESMIVTGFHKRMDHLQYIVGTVSDHWLVVNGCQQISLRDLCGKNAVVSFHCEHFWF